MIELIAFFVAMFAYLCVGWGVYDGAGDVNYKRFWRLPFLFAWPVILGIALFFVIGLLLYKLMAYCVSKVIGNGS